MKKMYVLMALACSALGFSQDYELVTSASQLQANGSYVMVGKKNNVLWLLNTQNTNNRASSETTIDATTLPATIDASQLNNFKTITLESASGGNWLLKDGADGYLYASGTGTSNHLKITNNLGNVDNREVWTITVNTDNSADISSITTLTDRKTIKFNASNNPPLFSCYATGQTPVYLYKLSQAVATPSFSLSAASISGLNYNEGEGPSVSQSFTLSGDDMDNTDVTLTAPANFEVSLDNTAFTSTVALTAYNGAATTVYVRLASGLAVNTYTGNLSVTGGGAAAASVALDGEVIDVPSPAFMTSVAELEDLTYTENEGPSSPQSFTLTGTDMDGTDVTVTASEHFELSSDNTSFNDTITLTNYSGEVTTVYVRLKAALAIDSYTGTVTITGAGAENLTVNLSGDVTASASVKQDNIDGLSIYPNPARDIITIASNSTAVKNVTISDITGKKVIETSTAQNVNVANLKAGVYIIHITQDGKTALRKLVIK